MVVGYHQRPRSGAEPATACALRFVLQTPTAASQNPPPCVTAVTRSLVVTPLFERIVGEKPRVSSPPPMEGEPAGGAGGEAEAERRGQREITLGDDIEVAVR